MNEEDEIDITKLIEYELRRIEQHIIKEFSLQNINLSYVETTHDKLVRQLKRENYQTVSRYVNNFIDYCNDYIVDLDINLDPEETRYLRKELNRKYLLMLGWTEEEFKNAGWKMWL